MHKLLERQLRKLGTFSAPPRFADFVAAVDAAYAQADSDRQMVERSLALASDELLERNRQLREDIQRRKELEIELAQAEKLRAVGQLASGIAHELNTPIQYVSDNLDFLQKAFQALAVFIAQGVERESGKARSKLDFMQQNIPGALDAALDGCRRVSEIVQAMKIFAHPDGGACAPADINRALSSTLAVARNAVRYVADVELDLGELPLVECRIGDINQVFLNLIINAAHAVADRHGPEGRGTIRLSTCVRGDQVVVAIADDGCGIPEAIQPRIFEPFFTTKEVGKGTGQGLAISRSIVAERHGGSLSFQTAPGVGTTFTMELPLTAKPEACVESIRNQIPLPAPCGDVFGSNGQLMIG